MPNLVMVVEPKVPVWFGDVIMYLMFSDVRFEYLFDCGRIEWSWKSIPLICL